MTPNEQWAELERSMDEKGNRHCAEEVAKRYTGARCMGTIIDDHVPNNADLSHNFFFDERYILQCHQTTSKARRATLPGMCHFEYLTTQEQTIYRRYNNVIERRRKIGPFRCPHPIIRVPAPVPNLTDCDTEGSWHYFSFMELFGPAS